MLRTHEGAHQHEIEMVTIESLVPPDHLLRKIDSAISFEFIREKVRHLYCEDNGRPALDPVVRFKLLFLGYLFGVRSERQLMREVQCNAAYRWFLRLKLTDKVADACMLSQNWRRFRHGEVYQQIFDQIVELAAQYGFVTGEVLYTDATHLKANANKNKFEVQRAEVKAVEYLAQLEQAMEEDRAAHGKGGLKPQASAPATKEIKVSHTDPDAGYMVREGKPKGFFDLDQRTVDGKHAIITDTHATPASVHDSVPYLERLDRQRERFGFKVSGVGLDAGYATTAIAKGLAERGIYGVTGYRRPNRREGLFPKRKFSYEEKLDAYVCPNEQRLAYRTTNREGYRQYHSDPKLCRTCPLRPQCTRSRNLTKLVTRHVWQANRRTSAAFPAACGSAAGRFS
jgi:transposase